MDPILKALAACGAGKTVGTNASRNLHRLIQKQGRTLPVQIESVSTPIRVVAKGRLRRVDCCYPVIMPSAWLEYSLSVGGEAFLGGQCLDAEQSYRSMFLDFWTKYRTTHPTFDLYQRPEYSDEFASTCIPVSVHGDEGRAKAKRAIMILSLQPVIGPKGIQYINTSGKLGYI